MIDYQHIERPFARLQFESDSFHSSEDRCRFFLHLPGGGPQRNIKDPFYTGIVENWPIDSGKAAEALCEYRHRHMLKHETAIHYLRGVIAIRTGLR